MLDSSLGIEKALQRVGEILSAEGRSCTVVIIGGAALNLLGIISRGTTDVDILALGGSGASQTMRQPPDPLPEELRRASRTVALEMGLATDWLNAGPSDLWRVGLPDGIETRIQWRRYSALEVGVAARTDLIQFKLYAAVNDSPRGAHYRDLLALHPSAEELGIAEAWVARQDAGPEFPRLLKETVAHVQRDIR